MVVASIVAFLFQWKSIVRSFSSLGAMFSLSKKRKLTDVEKIETPMSWFLTGQLISLGALGYLAHTSFNVPYWMSCIAVVISFSWRWSSAESPEKPILHPPEPWEKLHSSSSEGLHPDT